MKRAILCLLLLTLSGTASAQRYLGQLSSNPYNSESTSNQYGAGNPYNANSVNNDYGQ